MTKMAMTKAAMAKADEAGRTPGRRKSTGWRVGVVGSGLLLLMIGCRSPDSSEASAESEAVAESEVDGVEATYQRVLPPGTMEVVDIEAGTRVGRNLRIAEPTVQFEREDPIYVVVVTEGGEPGAMLEVRWTNEEGEVLHHEIERVRSGRRYLEFSAPNRPEWPLGSYGVELLLAGEDAGSIEFEIVEEVEERGLLERWLDP